MLAEGLGRYRWVVWALGTEVRQRPSLHLALMLRPALLHLQCTCPLSMNLAHLPHSGGPKLAQQQRQEHV